MIDQTIIYKFKASLHGQFVQPGDMDYDDARKVWNGMIDKHPALIVRCIDEADVVASINFARTQELLVAVRGGAHNVAGFGTCNEGIVIDLSLMKKIEIDAEARIARAQPGLTWGEFDKATQAYNLATTGGLVSTTGIAGFTLGGGFGWLVRKYGLTVDNLLSVDLVLANGQKLTASPSENADLFWVFAVAAETLVLSPHSVTSFTMLVPMYMVGPSFTRSKRLKRYCSFIANGHQQCPTNSLRWLLS